MIPLVEHRAFKPKQVTHVDMPPDQIAHRLTDSLRMLRDKDEVNALVTVHMQLLHIRRRLLAYRRRRIDALRLIDHDQILRFRLFVPLTQPRFVNLDVLDCQISNTVDQHATPLRNFRQQPNRMQRLTAPRNPCNQRDHLLNTILVVDVSM
ncbi:hypothetical protein DO72_3747 [Burkholderia pseudomallei]|nr:hypothetical protein DO72_3747 [Burkholderia pseudomallei]